MQANDWAKLAIAAERKKPTTGAAREQESPPRQSARRKMTRADLDTRTRQRRKGEPRRVKKNLFALKLCGDNKILMPLWARRSNYFSVVYRVCKNEPDFYKRVCAARDSGEFEALIVEARHLASAEPERYRTHRSKPSARALAREKDYLVGVARSMAESGELISFVREAKINTGDSFVRRTREISIELIRCGRSDLAKKFMEYAYERLNAEGKLDKVRELAK